MTNPAGPEGCSCSYDRLVPQAQIREALDACPIHGAGQLRARLDLGPDTVLAPDAVVRLDDRAPLFAGDRVQIGQVDMLEVEAGGLVANMTLWWDVAKLVGITAMTMPVHDGPVAWRIEGRLEWLGFPLVLCPAFLLDGIVRLGQVPDEVTVLDSMPGVHPRRR